MRPILVAKRAASCTRTFMPPRPAEGRDAALSGAWASHEASRQYTPAAGPELRRIEVADLTEVPDGLRVEPPRQDPTGKGQGLSSPYRGYRLRPSKRCRRGWRAAEISVDPVFRPVLKGDRIQDAPLSAFSAAQIVKHRRARGPRSGAYAGHSLRSRFLTTAEAGASMFKMAERRKSVDVSRADLFREHARWFL